MYFIFIKSTYTRPTAGHEPTGPRGVFQVTQQISDEHSGMSTEPDKTSSEFGILAQRLREMVQRPAPENFETIDIEQLLRRLIPRSRKRNSRSQKRKEWTTERREMLPDPGRAVSHPDQ